MTSLQRLFFVSYCLPLSSTSLIHDMDAITFHVRRAAVLLFTFFISVLANGYANAYYDALGGSSPPGVLIRGLGWLAASTVNSKFQVPPTPAEETWLLYVVLAPVVAGHVWNPFEGRERFSWAKPY
ncbi:hypothetical protein BDY21DRAFT_359681 [Lineolata rhizophorae]|uniref:Uncharacterized protein n=1 Tax=Lineolata rhizophorae TaxID=578093 RepID=A0A6A6NLA1_9PEZI|nr:hypothetical protein BDY21DRAFT_359681 [Lineolata rhizophorae]